MKGKKLEETPLVDFFNERMRRYFQINVFCKSIAKFLRNAGINCEKAQLLISWCPK